MASDTQQIKTTPPLELAGGGDERGSGPVHTHLFIARECAVLLPGDGSMGLSRYCFTYLLSGKSHGNEHFQVKKKDELTHSLNPVFQRYLKELQLLSSKYVD